MAPSGSVSTTSVPEAGADDTSTSAPIVRGCLRAHGSALDAEHVRELLALDNELNAQGIAVWLNRKNREKKTEGAAA